MGKVYMLGDVHNEADKLVDLWNTVEPMITPEDHVVFCGDLINRGLLAARTLEKLIEIARKYPSQVFFVRGNHDWMLENYLTTGNMEWMEYLKVTLEDLKKEWSLPDTLPLTMIDALASKGFRDIVERTIPYYETEEILATHAPLDANTCFAYGLQNYTEYWESDKDQVGFSWFVERLSTSILWDFTDENDQIEEFEKFRVCGHQPGRHKMPRIFKNRAFIDTGCGKGKRPLTCMVYPGKKFWQSKA
jgi:hypothetical protein